MTFGTLKLGLGLGGSRGGGKAFDPLALEGLTVFLDAINLDAEDDADVTTWTNDAPDGVGDVDVLSMSHIFQYKSEGVEGTAGVRMKLPTSTFAKVATGMYSSVGTIIVFSAMLPAGVRTVNPPGCYLGLVSGSAYFNASSETIASYQSAEGSAGVPITSQNYNLTEVNMTAVRFIDNSSALFRLNDSADVSFDPTNTYDDTAGIRVGAINNTTATAEHEYKLVLVLDRCISDEELDNIYKYGINRYSNNITAMIIGDSTYDNWGLHGGDTAYITELSSYTTKEVYLRDVGKSGKSLLDSEIAGTSFIDDSVTPYIRGTVYNNNIPFVTKKNMVQVIHISLGINDLASGLQSADNFRNGVSALLGFLRADFPNVRAITWVPIGRNFNNNVHIADYQTVREILFDSFDENQMKRGEEIYDLPIDSDDAGVHPNATSIPIHGTRAAARAAQYLGLKSGSDYPYVSSVSRDVANNRLICTVTHVNGSDITVDSGCEPLFRVAAGVTLETPSAVTRLSATTFALTTTLSATADTVYIGYGTFYGLDAENPEVIVDDIGLPILSNIVTL